MPPIDQPNGQPVEATHSEQPNNPAVENQFEELFRFNPFGGGGDGGAAAATSTPASPQPSNGTGTGGTPAAAPTQQNAPQTPATPAALPSATPAAPAQPTVSAEAQALRDAAQSLSQAATAVRSPTPQPGGQTPDPALDYMFEFPPQIQQMMNSENPADRMRAQQITHAAYLSEAHKRIRGEMLNFARTEVPKMIQQALHAHTFRQTIQSDFFGKYPMLKDPALAPIVQSMTQQVMSNQPSGQNVSWSDALRDQIAEKIFVLIPHLRPQAAAPQPGGATPPVSPAQPPRIFTNGSRPSETPGTSKEEQIMRTLFTPQH